MSLDRHQARILAMQMLSQLEAQGDDALGQLDEFLAEAKVKPATAGYVREIVSDCWARREEVDKRIAGQLEHWGMERLSLVERNVLRVGLFELGGGDVPPKVVINEAIEIAREYGGPESARFVNGILDGLWKQQQTTETELRTKK